MNLIDWVPSFTMAAIFGLVLWLCRNLIETRLKRSVKHEFDTKLESLRSELRKNEELFIADLRTKDAEITALRGSVMTAMANRQVALDKRRLEAVDQIWSSVTALAPAKGISSVIAALKYENAVDMAASNEKIRQMFTRIGSDFDIMKIDISNSTKAQPFVSPMAWALFSAYKATLMYATLKLELLRTEIGTTKILNKTGVAKIVKAAIPQYEAYIEKHGDSAYHYLLDELENRLLEELRRMLTGVESDKANAEQVAEIIKQSNELLNSIEQKPAQG